MQWHFVRTLDATARAHERAFHLLRDSIRLDTVPRLRPLVCVASLTCCNVGTRSDDSIGKLLPAIVERADGLGVEVLEVDASSALLL